MGGDKNGRSANQWSHHRIYWLAHDSTQQNENMPFYTSHAQQHSASNSKSQADPNGHPNSRPTSSTKLKSLNLNPNTIPSSGKILKSKFKPSLNFDTQAHPLSPIWHKTYDKNINGVTEYLIINRH